MFLRRLKPYIFANRFVLSNRFIQKRLSALAYDIDYQYENQYIKYDFETKLNDYAGKTIFDYAKNSRNIYISELP